MRFFIIVGFLLLSLTIFSSPAGKWVNTQQKMTIEFKNNGNFNWIVGNNIVKGTWKQLNQQVLQTYANGQITQYVFLVKNNMLGLMAKNGAQIYLTKVNSYNNSTTSSINIKKFLGTWYTTNGKIVFKIKFNKNGIYKVIVNNKVTIGNWNLNGNVITTNLDNVKTQYSYTFKNGFMILAQSKTNYIVFGKKKSYFVGLLKKIQKNNKKTQKYTASTNNKALTDAQFMYLLENYAKMHPNTVYTYLTKFSKSQKTWIPIFTAWYNLMVFRACQGTLAYNNTQDKQMCANSKAQYQKTMQLFQSLSMQGSDPFAKSKTETSKLLISYKCKYGLIDKASCKMYMGIQSNINKMQNKTTNIIIKNMEPLPCVKHYEQGTNAYLGCY